MRYPRLLVFDRDSTLTLGSGDEQSPFYYILDLNHLIIKPGAREVATIVKALGVPAYLATKQRCVSKGLITMEGVDLINARLERLLDLSFDEIYVEPSADNKLDIYRQILRRHPDIAPQDIWLFDDSEAERTIAARLGFTVYDGTDIYSAFTKSLGLR